MTQLVGKIGFYIDPIQNKPVNSDTLMALLKRLTRTIKIKFLTYV